MTITAVTSGAMLGIGLLFEARTKAARDFANKHNKSSKGEQASSSAQPFLALRKVLDDPQHRVTIDVVHCGCGQDISQAGLG